MGQNFLESYLHAMPAIQGWFSFDAALMFMAYHELVLQRGITGDVLEIGVHHGLSTIALAAMRAPNADLHAVDLFEELQGQNISGSGGGNREVFEDNMRRFFPQTGFLQILSCESSELTPGRFERPFSFCHVDGGHSVDETCRDLELCHDILSEGGLLALDDYFNPEFPGVCEGAIRFARRRPEAVRPLAIGFNKVLLQKTPAPADLNAEFAMRFPAVPRKTVSFWNAPIPLFPIPFRFCFDLQASSPRKLIPISDGGLEAILSADPKTYTAKPSETVPVTVTVSNSSKRVLAGGAGALGVSYHLLAESREMLQYDNDRVYLTQPLLPGERRVVILPVRAPRLPGLYLVEIDLVWEGVTWFKEAGNAPPTLRMTVS